MRIPEVSYASKAAAAAIRVILRPVTWTATWTVAWTVQRRAQRIGLALLGSWLVAVGGPGCGEPAPPQAGGCGLKVKRVSLHQAACELKPSGRIGLSSLARDPSGGIWTTPEEPPSDGLHVMIRLDPRTGAFAEIVRIRGIPASRDLESLAWLDGRHVVVGTEGDDVATPLLYLLERTGATATARAHWAPDAQALAWFEPKRNHGIEGLDHSGRRLVFGLENSLIGAEAQALVGVIDVPPGNPAEAFAGLTASYSRVTLLPQGGRLSALACSQATRRGGIDVRIVQRRISRTNLLQATLRPAAATRLEDVPVATSKQVFDPRTTSCAELGFATAQATPNWEGLLWADGTTLILNDNWYGATAQYRSALWTVRGLP